MTSLIEYLSQQAAELRERAERRQGSAQGTWLSSDPDAEYALFRGSLGAVDAALADHVEKMLTEHPYNTIGVQPRSCAGCGRWADCPSIRFLADLVATVTRNPIPEGVR